MKASESSGDLGHLVAGGGQGVEDPQQAGRGVEGDGVADAAALGRVGGEDDADPLVGVVEAAEAGQAGGEAGDALDPVGDGPVGGQGHAELVAVVDDLLERERGTDDPPVELGDGHAEGDVEGGQAAARLGPGGRCRRWTPPPGGRARRGRRGATTSLSPVAAATASPSWTLPPAAHVVVTTTSAPRRRSRAAGSLRRE